MKRAQSVVAVALGAVVVATVATVAMGPVLAAAQTGQAQTPASQSLVDVAKAEEARRKGVRKPAKVYTNGDLKPASSTAVPPAPATPASAAPGNATPAINIPGGTVPAATSETRDQAFWADRISTARTAYDRSRMFAEALQSRINALTTDFVNRDDPVQRAKIEGDRKTALAELDRVRTEMAGQQKAIADIEEEARRAGVPSGWLRPGA